MFFSSLPVKCFSMPPLCLCGECFPKQIHHRRTKDTKLAQSFAFILAASYDAAGNAHDNKIKEVDAMKFPGGLNIQQMMKQAQVMQEKMSKEMEELRTEASAGGGVVTVEMKGNHEIVSLKIDPEAVKEGDVEMLQDMILAAINEANRKVDEAMKGKLGGMLPPGMGGLLG
jgi:nucleoid-associated protein EbfC